MTQDPHTRTHTTRHTPQKTTQSHTHTHTHTGARTSNTHGSHTAPTPTHSGENHKHTTGLQGRWGTTDNTKHRHMHTQLFTQRGHTSHTHTNTNTEGTTAGITNSTPHTTTHAHTPHTPRTHTEHHQPPHTSIPQPGMAGNCIQGPQPALARDHPPPPAAEPSQEWGATATAALSQEWQGTSHQTPGANLSQEWRATTPRTLSQDWRLTTHLHQQQIPARNGRELHQGPSARICEGPPSNARSKPQPGLAGNWIQDPHPEMARDHPPPPAASSSQELRGIAPRMLRQYWPGPTRRWQQQSQAGNGRELHLGPSARIGERPPTTSTPNRTRSGDTHAAPRQTQTRRAPQKGPQTRERTRRVKPHMTNTHIAQPPIPHQQTVPPLQAADPSQEWRGTKPRARSQDE